jgi:catechol 2,3-dioxygenase-like lactoylglutathione lyase family enzyme
VRAFYGRLLGLEEIAPPSTLSHRGLVWFSAGADQLELHFFPGAVDAEHGRHLCLEVEDLEFARRQLEAGGYTLYDATPIPRRPRFFCRDPFGNLVELTTILVNSET